MRFIIFAFAISSFVPACGGSNGEQAYDTLQLCYDDHHTGEMLSVNDSITICCIDHPIAGVHPSCGTTQAACEAIVRAGLDVSVTDADVTAACMSYITQMGL